MYVLYVQYTRNTMLKCNYFVLHQVIVLHYFILVESTLNSSAVDLASRPGHWLEAS